MMEKLDNAKKYGNVDGEEAYKREGRKEFTFASPYDGFKPLDAATKAMQAENPGPENITQDEYGGVWYGVTESRAKDRLKVLTNDAYGEYEKWFNEMPEDERLGDNVVDHLYQATQGALEKKYAGNSTDIFRTKKDGTGKSGTGTTDPNKTFWQETVMDTALARRKKGIPGVVSADGMGIMNMIANDDGKVSIDGSSKLMVNVKGGKKGEAQTVQSTLHDLGLTGNYDIEIPNNAVVTVETDDQGYDQPYVDSWITVGADQAQQAEKHIAKQAEKWINEEEFIDANGDPIEVDGIFDFVNFNNLPFTDIDEMNDVIFREPYKSSVRLVADDDDPNKVKGIQFKMKVPIPISQSSQLRYDNTTQNKYKAGAAPTGAKPKVESGTTVKLDTGEMVELVGYDHNGKMIWKPSKK